MGLSTALPHLTGHGLLGDSTEMLLVCKAVRTMSTGPLRVLKSTMAPHLEDSRTNSKMERWLVYAASSWRTALGRSEEIWVPERKEKWGPGRAWLEMVTTSPVALGTQGGFLSGLFLCPQK